MLYHVANQLTLYISAFNVIHYISFRAIAALLTSIVFYIAFGPWFITYAQRFAAKSREWTPENHRKKDNTPTMGGLFIIAAVITSALLWCNLCKANVWIFIGCLASFGALGLWDDLQKIRNGRGISIRAKWLAQIGIAITITSLLLICNIIPPTLCVPFFKNFNPSLGMLFVPWASFILVACSNAVNLTDGLDGLAISVLMPNLAVFSFLCYAAGNFVIANYLNIPFVESGEIAVIGCGLIGASLGFLWYNSYPAQIFMGDVGALSLGAALALMAIMSKQELILPIAGGIFVIETLSVMAQIYFFRSRGKRFFRMAPIHHHLELLGWPETKITVRFTIISIVLCLLAFITIKLR